MKRNILKPVHVYFYTYLLYRCVHIEELGSIWETPCQYSQHESYTE